MSYAIIGTGNVGSALARRFTHSGIAVRIANTRGPESIVDLANELGSAVTATSLDDALEADIVIFAVPFAAHRALALRRANWLGKIVVVAMIAHEARPGELGGLQSPDAVAAGCPGAEGGSLLRYRGPLVLQNLIKLG
jgi:8-hydroxy-5-deazaflavin:NADPH oxidoreductase